MVLDGPMTGAWFLAYVERSSRRRSSPGERRDPGHLPAHKGEAAREAVAATGARLLFLPPYSPDINPIENAFAKLKALPEKPPPAPCELWRVIAGASTLHAR